MCVCSHGFVNRHCSAHVPVRHYYYVNKSIALILHLLLLASARNCDDFLLGAKAVNHSKCLCSNWLGSVGGSLGRGVFFVHDL